MFIGSIEVYYETIKKEHRRVKGDGKKNGADTYVTSSSAFGT
jgi:hypothetical protein